MKMAAVSIILSIIVRTKPETEMMVIITFKLITLIK